MRQTLGNVLVAALLLTAAGASCRAAAPVGPPAFEQTGEASYYADALAGRPTASGEPYDPQKPTCAHSTLPFDTWLLVTVTTSGAKARCRVNDRGPYAKGRVLDVSRSVAEALGLVTQGTAMVRLQGVSPP